MKRAFDEQIRAAAPRPPGAHVTIGRRTRCEVTGHRTVKFPPTRFRRPRPRQAQRDPQDEHPVLGAARPRLRHQVQRRRGVGDPARAAEVWGAATEGATSRPLRIGVLGGSGAVAAVAEQVAADLRRVLALDVEMTGYDGEQE